MWIFHISFTKLLSWHSKCAFKLSVLTNKWSPSPCCCKLTADILHFLLLFLRLETGVERYIESLFDLKNYFCSCLGFFWWYSSRRRWVKLVSPFPGLRFISSEPSDPVTIKQVSFWGSYSRLSTWKHCCCSSHFYFLAFPENDRKTKSDPLFGLPTSPEQLLVRLSEIFLFLPPGTILCSLISVYIFWEMILMLGNNFFWVI